MIGNNEINFNEATMVEIVQYYLDNKLFKEKSPTVTSVKKVQSNYTGDTFSVTLVTKDEIK